MLKFLLVIFGSKDLGLLLEEMDKKDKIEEVV